MLHIGSCKIVLVWLYVLQHMQIQAFYIYAGLDGCLAFEKKSHDLSPEGAGAGDVRILLVVTFRKTRPHSGALCKDMWFNSGFVLYCMFNARHQAKRHCHRMIVFASGMDDAALFL